MAVTNLGIKMDDTLIAISEPGYGFEMYADDEGVTLLQDEAEMYFTYQEAYEIFLALAGVFASDEEEDEEEVDYYEFEV